MKQILYKLFDHQYLGRKEASTLLKRIACNEYTDAQVASLITVFLMRSITIEELTGFKEALLDMSHVVDLKGTKVIDIVGTGGDGKNTFNISTCASFVVAAAGYPVVKHGNYGATSVSGASNVIEQHGVKFSNDNDLILRSLDRCNMAFLHAPLFNPAMKAIAPIRKSLGVRTFFNLLGPLINPALPAYQLLGVYNLSMQRLYGYAYQKSNIKATVVFSLDGYDEISLTSPFKVVTSQNEKIYTPEELGFKTHSQNSLNGGNTIEEAVVCFDNVLQNKSLPEQKNVVVANAGFAINTICPEKTIENCLEEARLSLESGKALDIFKKFVVLNS